MASILWIYCFSSSLASGLARYRAECVGRSFAIRSSIRSCTVVIGSWRPSHIYSHIIAYRRTCNDKLQIASALLIRLANLGLCFHLILLLSHVGPFLIPTLLRILVSGMYRFILRFTAAWTDLHLPSCMARHFGPVSCTAEHWTLMPKP